MRDIAINTGTLYIETLSGTAVHHGDDMVVWLEKDRCDEGDQTCFWASPQAQPGPTSQTQPAHQTPASEAVVDPRLAPVAYALNGKVHVQTAVGLVIIEGEHLKVYSPTPQAAVGIRQHP